MPNTHAATTVRLLPILLVAATLGAALLGAESGAGDDGSPPTAAASRTFSRAEWIEAHEKTSRFEGGVLPTKGRPVARRPGVVYAPAKPVGYSAVTVSADLVPPGAPPAQDETQAEPHLAIDLADEARLVAGYQEGRYSNGGARALGYSWSHDGGASWNAGLIPGLTQLTGGPWQRASDPWVAFGPPGDDGTPGRAYYVSLAFNETNPANAIVVSSSDDGGATWGNPVTVHSPSGTNFDDKEAITVDTFDGSPYRGRVYVAWDMATEGLFQPLLLSWSDDGGHTFSPAVQVAGGINLGAFPVVGPGGVLHMIWGQFDLFPNGDVQRVVLVASRSTDGGATWSEPVAIDESLAHGVPMMRTGDGIPSAAIDRKTGALYVVWADARRTVGVDQVLLSRSTDGGNSWSKPVMVSDGPTNAPAFTPAVAVDGSGRVGVAYSSLRNDPERRFGVDLYMAFSKNGGKKFTKSVRISSSSWDVRAAALSRGFFLGDYQGLVAGKKLFHPLFVATWQASAVDGNRLQPDVFSATVK